MIGSQLFKFYIVDNRRMRFRLFSRILLTQLSLLCFLSPASSQTRNDVRLFVPTNSNLSRYQQSLVRLLSRSQTFQLGVVQLYLDGKWGSVCDDSWSSVDSRVVCSQLNLSYALSYTDLPLLRGLEQESPPDTPIWLDEVDCSGDERLLVQCPSLPLGAHDCTHTEDVNIMCSAINLVGIYQGIIAAIVILLISIPICCLCCCCCCCPCCPVARYLRPRRIQSEGEDLQEQVLLRNKESLILEYLPSPSPVQETTHTHEPYSVTNPNVYY